MSKSLGNVVDPLNVIDEQGCDALRFTLATGTAAGQDLNLNMDRLASNRNFTNKIWNSGKFVLYSLEGMSDEERVELVAGRRRCPAHSTRFPSRNDESSRGCTPSSTTSRPRTTGTTSARLAGRRTRSSTTISPIGSSRAPSPVYTAAIQPRRSSRRLSRSTSWTAPSRCCTRSCRTSRRRCGGTYRTRARR